MDLDPCREESIDSKLIFLDYRPSWDPMLVENRLLYSPATDGATGKYKLRRMEYKTVSPSLDLISNVRLTRVCSSLR